MGKQVKKKIQPDNVMIIKGFHKNRHPVSVTVFFQTFISHHGFVPSHMRDLQSNKVNLPIFNYDKKSYTPAFKLLSDQLDDEHYQQKQKNKKQQYEPISQDQIMMPRPKDKKYCHVCDYRFQDYQQHIDSDKHKKELAQNKYQQRIQRLCRRIQKMQQKPKTVKTTAQSDREESFNMNSKQNHSDLNNLASVAT